MSVQRVDWAVAANRVNRNKVRWFVVRFFDGTKFVFFFSRKIQINQQRTVDCTKISRHHAHARNRESSEQEEYLSKSSGISFEIQHRHGKNRSVFVFSKEKNLFFFSSISGQKRPWRSNWSTAMAKIIKLKLLWLDQKFYNRIIQLLKLTSLKPCRSITKTSRPGLFGVTSNIYRQIMKQPKVN